MHGLKRKLWHTRNKIALRCKLWYNKIVVNDVVKHKITMEEILMVTRKELLEDILTWDIIIIF